jgi:nicotinamidase-related amidase
MIDCICVVEYLLANKEKHMKLKNYMTIAILMATGLARAEAPRTLFELSGVMRPQIDLKKSVLIIIDAQEEYRTGSLRLTKIDESIHTIKSLLNRARSLNVPVIHVMHEGSAGGLFDPATRNFKIISELSPKDGEKIILKHLPDAFANTNLEKEIRKFGENKTLIFVGFMTHMCISASAMTALNLGFQNAVVTDAVSTRDLRGSRGETIRAETVNEVALAALQDRFVWLVSSDQLLEM